VVVSAALRLSVPQPEVLRYRSNAEPLPPPPAKPFAHRRLRPGEEKLVSESKTVFLPRREKVGFGFHIDENGVVDGLAKTENGAQIATGLSIGMRLLAVDAVYIHSTAEVSELLAKHAVGRAARFELRPAPPAAEEVFAEKKQEKAKQQAAIDAALMAASKPYGKKFEVWEAEQVRGTLLAFLRLFLTIHVKAIVCQDRLGTKVTQAELKHKKFVVSLHCRQR
jgi:hypothetical protein